MKTSLLAGACSALLLTFAAAAPALAQTAPPAAESMFRATTLNLAAYGEVKVVPDMATITLGVQVEAPTAAQAMTQNAVRMNGVIAALRRAGIAEKDIQTSNLNLNPQYAYVERQPPRLTGYQASNTVTVRVYDLARLGQTLDAVVNAGGNQIQGVGFGLRDSLAAENQGRMLAVQALQSKAQLYATASGHQVSRLITLTEGASYSAPPPMPMYRMEVAQAAAPPPPTPVAPGEMTVRIDVSGMFELTR